MASDPQFCEERSRITCHERNHVCAWNVTLVLDVARYTSYCRPSDQCDNTPHASRQTHDCGSAGCVFCCTTPNCRLDSVAKNNIYTTRLSSTVKLKADPKGRPRAQMQEVIRSMIKSFEFQGTLETYAVKNRSVYVSAQFKVPVNVTTASLRDRFHDWTVGFLISVDIFNTSTLATTAIGLCPSETIPSAVGDITWPTIATGDYVRMRCPVGQGSGRPTAFISRECEIGSPTARWTPPPGNICSANTSDKDDRKLINVDITPENVLQVSETLVTVTANPESMSPGRVGLVAEVLTKVTADDAPPFGDDVAGNLMDSFDNLMSVSPEALGQAEEDSKAGNKILKSIDKFSNNYQLSDTEKSFVKPSVAIVIADPDAVPSGSGLTFDGISLKRDSMSESNNQTLIASPGVTLSSITLPPGLLDVGTNASNKLQFVSYQSGSFFEALAETSPGHVINSQVIAAGLSLGEVKDLEEPIVISLKLTNSNIFNDPQCVFWDFELQDWSTRGCHLKEYVNGSRAVCHCDHLTNFALLMDIYGNVGELDGNHQTALSFISYIGCGLSILGLSLTLLTYCLFRKLRKDYPSKILCNLCVALLGTTLCFVIATQAVVTKEPIACKLFAILLHYFLLSAMCWMGVEAYYMYLALVKVFQTYYSKFILKCGLAAWGLPLVIIVITLAIGVENYGADNETNAICWLSRFAFFGAFLAPVGIILIINIFAFTMVVNKLYGVAAKKVEQGRKVDIKIQLKGALGVIALLGLTWVFAVFAVQGASVVFHYLFTLFNSLQGLFIFLFYCVWKPDVRTAWKRALNQEKPGLESRTHSGAHTHSTSDSRSKRKRSNQTVSATQKKSSPTRESISYNGVGDGEVKVACV